MKLELGIVAINKDTFKAHRGAYDEISPKIYQSKNRARVDNYYFLPAYVEFPSDGYIPIFVPLQT
jgi:hypothetical protein